MTQFILDTDHFTLLRRAQPAVVTRAVAVPRNQLAISVITVEEQVTGWYTAVRKARDASRLARADGNMAMGNDGSTRDSWRSPGRHC